MDIQKIIAEHKDQIIQGANERVRSQRVKGERDSVNDGGEPENVSKPANAPSDMSAAKIMGLFGYEDYSRIDDKTRSKLMEVSKFFDGDPEAIRRWEARIGSPPMGVDRLNHLYGSIKLRGYSRYVNAAEDSNSERTEQGGSGDPPGITITITK